MRQYRSLLLALILATALPPALAADSNTPALAESSDAAAQFRQAQNLALGDSPDIPAAMRWYEKAAQQGHAKAQTALASCISTSRATAPAKNWHKGNGGSNKRPRNMKPPPNPSLALMRR